MKRKMTQRGYGNMGMAYTITSAAQAASVEKSDIALAIQEGRLRARRIRGNPLILRTDLQTWLDSLPDF